MRFREAAILQRRRAHEALMHLLADRFAVVDSQSTIDLATGEHVELTIATAGGETDQRRWTMHCDARRRLHHPSLARLVDYGAMGESRRFEAHARRTCRVAAGVPALAIIDRPGVAALGELFERPDFLRPRIAGLWGPEGAGKGTVVGDLARVARLHGFVPVDARLMPQFADLLAGRSLFVIDDGERRDGWSVLLCASAGSCRPHVLLFVGREEPRGLDGIGLMPLDRDALIQSVRPRHLARRCPALIDRIAVESAGWPGRFADLLWQLPMEQRASPHRNSPRLAPSIGAVQQTARRWMATPAVPARPLPVRAAEQPAVYDAASPSVQVDETGVVAEWPAADELTALQRRLEISVQLIDRGRHGPGERALRQTIGALARRHHWAPAGDGAAILAALLLRRGRGREAQGVVNTAAEYFRRAGADPRLLDVAILDGNAAIDLAHVEEAETKLSAAVAAARALGDRRRVSAAQIALARALFWNGRYDAGSRTLQGIVEAGLADSDSVVATGLKAALAVGARQFQAAVAGVSEATVLAERTGEPRLVADARGWSAFIHLAAGDVAAAERDALMAIGAARRAREPLTAASIRLHQVEILRRQGKLAAAGRLLRRVAGIRTSTLPPLLRARSELLREMCSRSGRTDDIVTRHVKATGLDALRLFVGVSQPSSMDFPAIMVDDIVGILDLCQTSDDERAVMLEVCRRVRVRLHAVAAGVAVSRRGTYILLASDGGRLDLKVAERAATGAVTIAPHRCEDRLEAAAPIRYGASTIGALVARWALGTLHDLTSAATLLTTTAAVVGPIVSSAEAHSQPAVGAVNSELIGSSDGIIDVRRGIERAAPAPFAVLIQGESGSGKELVARAIHRSGPRRDRSFGTVNCAALPDDLIEAELFGHARGAFTGAVAERRGVFEEANGGTLFLDEIGELSPRAQAKLLRVLQEGELRRVGESISRRVDVRVVSATNRDLRAEAAAGRFRLDLLYRLDVLRIAIPPLRERRDDIPALAEHFWRSATASVGSHAALSAATVAALARYDWPGNVRELQNVLASLAVRSARRGVVPPTALGLQFAENGLAEASRLDAARRAFEERFVRAALARTGGHRARTAEELGLSRQGLAKLMARLRIDYS